MAVKANISQQLVEGFRKYPIDDHGKYRLQHALAVNTVDAGDAGTTINLFKLPPGRVRILPRGMHVRCTAFGAARTISIGLRAYYPRPNTDPNPEEPTSISGGTYDVSAAGVLTVPAAAPFKYDVYSISEIMVFATLAGGTIPVGAELEVLLPYIYE